MEYERLGECQSVCLCKLVCTRSEAAGSVAAARMMHATPCPLPPHAPLFQCVLPVAERMLRLHPLQTAREQLRTSRRRRSSTCTTFRQPASSSLCTGYRVTYGAMVIVVRATRACRIREVQSCSEEQILKCEPAESWHAFPHSESAGRNFSGATSRIPSFGISVEEVDLDHTQRTISNPPIYLPHHRQNGSRCRSPRWHSLWYVRHCDHEQTAQCAGNRY